MKSYFRFFFLGALLLFLLGYFTENQGELATDASEPAGHEQQWQQPGSLPLLSAQDLQKFISIQRHPGGNIGDRQLSQEVYLRELTKNIFQESRELADDHSPDFIQKKGFYIHRCCRAEVPS